MKFNKESEGFEVRCAFFWRALEWFEYRSAVLHLVRVIALGILICGTVVGIVLLLVDHLLTQKARVDRMLRRRLICHLRGPVAPSGSSGLLVSSSKALAHAGMIRR